MIRETETFIDYPAICNNANKKTSHTHETFFVYPAIGKVDAMLPIGRPLSMCAP